MCLILFAYRQHPDYPLIVAANRDEFYQRPTQAAHFWPEYPELLAGKDLQAGGTWLGLTRQGRFAAVTNFRDAQSLTASAAAPCSRGQLTADFLTATTPAAEFLAELEPRAEDYGGFNLLVGDSQGLYYYSNRQGVIQPQGFIESQSIIEPLEPGIYGLSNHLLNTPWPKAEAGKTALAEALHQLPETALLLALLQNKTTADDGQLPDTGIPLDWERLLSAAFIQSDDYGTRASSIITISTEGEVVFTEQSYSAPSIEPGATTPCSASTFQFQLSPHEK